MTDELTSDRIEGIEIKPIGYTNMPHPDGTPGKRIVGAVFQDRWPTIQFFKKIFEASTPPSMAAMDDDKLRDGLCEAVSHDLASYGVQNDDAPWDVADTCLRYLRTYLRPTPPVDIGSEDILEAIINEHDMAVPDELLAAPNGFGAHRDAMRTALRNVLLRGK